MPSTGATICVSRTPSWASCERCLRLVDAGLRRLSVLVGIRVLARAQLCFRLGDDVLLLVDVVRRVRLLRLLNLLASLLDQRPLGLDVLRRCWLGGDQQLLLRLGDRVLGGLDFFVLRTGDELVEMRLVGLEFFARRIDLRLCRFALGVEAAVLGGTESSPGDGQVVLGRRELTLRLIVLRLQLGALGLHAAVGQRVQPGAGGLDQRLSAGDLRLHRGLAGRRAAPPQQVELTLGGLDGGVAGLNRRVRGGLGHATRGAIG